MVITFGSVVWKDCITGPHHDSWDERRVEEQEMKQSRRQREDEVGPAEIKAEQGRCDGERRRPRNQRQLFSGDAGSFC